MYTEKLIKEYNKCLSWNTIFYWSIIWYFSINTLFWHVEMSCIVQTEPMYTIYKSMLFFQKNVNFPMIKIEMKSLRVRSTTIVRFLMVRSTLRIGYNQRTINSEVLKLFRVAKLKNQSKYKIAFYIYILLVV